jgi:hypothetical protein
VNTLADLLMPRYVLASEMTQAEVIAAILRTCFPDAASVYDATYGYGGFLNGNLLNHLEVTATDLNPEREAPNGVADVRHLPFADGEFDVVLFDPPHNADAGKESIMGTRFGSYTEKELEQVVRQGTRECWRVARLGIVVKITDAVHGQRYVCMSDWVRESLGNSPMVPYDRVDYVRRSNIEDPRWTQKGEPCSMRNNGSTFLVFRKNSQRHKRHGLQNNGNQSNALG